MDFWHLGVTVYVFITIVALTLTWREQLRTGRRSPLVNAGSIMACALWPLAMTVLFVAMRWLQLRQRAV